MKKIILLVCITILIFMTIQNWGALQKSADDDETIEEAINRLIAVHEGDSNSHLGEGESMQNHKSADVIDHPAQSLVPDKFSNKQSFLNLPVIPLFTDNIDNCLSYVASPFAHLYQDTGYSSAGTYNIADFMPADLGYVGGDVDFDFMLLGYGGSGTWSHEFSFGFGKIQIKNGYYRIGYYTTSWQYSDWISHSVAYPLRFRFEYNSTTNYLYVFLKDVQVFSVSYTMALEDDEFLVFATIDRKTSSYSDFFIGNLNVWFDGI